MILGFTIILACYFDGYFIFKAVRAAKKRAREENRYFDDGVYGLPCVLVVVTTIALFIFIGHGIWYLDSERQLQMQAESVRVNCDKDILQDLPEIAGELGLNTALQNKEYIATVTSRCLDAKTKFIERNGPGANILKHPNWWNKYVISWAVFYPDNYLEIYEATINY